MARKVQPVTITAANRDQGKVFIITEMSAMRAEKWALRALQGMIAAGIDLPADMANAGIASIATMGLQSIGSLPWTVAESLLDELLTCVQIQPDKARPDIVRGLIADDIEELSTILQLRKEAFALHISFLPAAA